MVLPEGLPGGGGGRESGCLAWGLGTPPISGSPPYPKGREASLGPWGSWHWSPIMLEKGPDPGSGLSNNTGSMALGNSGLLQASVSTSGKWGHLSRRLGRGGL